MGLDKIVRKTFVCSAISKVSSTSIPRQKTVRSNLVRQRRNFAAWRDGIRYSPIIATP